VDNETKVSDSDDNTLESEEGFHVVHVLPPLETIFGDIEDGSHLIEMTENDLLVNFLCITRSNGSLCEHMVNSRYTSNGKDVLTQFIGDGLDAFVGLTEIIDSRLGW